jgi:hypothetical protein
LDTETTIRPRSRTSWWGDALRGAIAGGIAVWMMDLVTTGIQSSQSKADAAREAAARPNGLGSTTNLVETVAERLDVDVDDRTEATASQVVHYALGVVPGALYGACRGRLPALGAARGLLYGAALWAINDEAANAALGLSGPPEAYPLSTHVRGLVGHLALGLVTDAGLDITGGAARPN